MLSAVDYEATGPRRIVAEGRPDARIILIGEAGGENEERTGRPFVGPSGHKLNTWWTEVGLARSQFYIDNVYPFRPRYNNLANVPLDDLDEWAQNLHARIADLVDPWIIVPTGNTALRALMRRSLDDATVSITKYRGSIMAYVDNRGRSIKMIPTIHPASIYHQRAKKARGQEKANPGRTEKHCRLDWARIAAESASREVAAPEQTHYIVDSESDLAYWLEQYHALPADTPITIDIETPHKVVDCVGFAWDPSFSISIPLRWPGYEDPEHPTFALRIAFITEVCAGPQPKVLQNGTFDVFWLWMAEGIVVANYIYDLMCLHHALDPVDDHDLAYMKSVFLRGEYHKDEAKSPEKVAKYASGYEAMLTYNGMDCCDQIDLFYVLSDRLKDAGRWQLYTECYAPLLPVLAEMSIGGMQTSRDERCRAHARLTADIIDIQNALSELAGESIWSKTDLSPVKLKRFLYEKLGLPPQRSKRKRDGTGGGLTVNEVALRKLQIRYSAKAGGAISLVLDHRRKMKLSQFLSDERTDTDGRLRCTYAPTTEAGRLASSKNAFGTGTNLQNQDRDPLVRGSFIPDRPDHVLLEFDCSQAESRIVYVLSGDDHLYNLAILPPDRFDQHSYNAALIFGAKRVADAEFKSLAVDHDFTPIGYVSKDQRYFGKRTVHGAQRGMGGDKMADELLKEDVIKTPDECQHAIDIYLQKHPGIADYFEWVRWDLLRNKRLTNSWGFCWDVRYEKMDPDLYRRAFSLKPQSEVAFLLNTWGLVPVAEFVRAWYGPDEARVIAQVHDSVVLSVAADARTIAAICRCAHEHLTRPRDYPSRRGPRTLAMPVEFKIGRTWVGDHEWKRLPTEDEIADALRTMAIHVA